MACEPDTLASDARAFQGLSPRTNLEVQTYLLASLAGGSMDPEVLAMQARDFRGMPGPLLQWMKTYLLCQLSISAVVVCTVAAPVIETEEFFGAFNVTWLGYAPDPGLGFRIEAGTSPGASDYFDAQVGPSFRNYEAGGVSAGTYYVRVYALESLTCESAASNEETVTV